jgi:hypothetical protein
MKPNRTQLSGMSPSQFKTLIKQAGHKVPRDFFKYGCVSHYKNRAYRWRHWGTDGFVVDISCPLSEFDRWANSCDRTISFEDWRNI